MARRYFLDANEQYYLTIRVKGRALNVFDNNIPEYLKRSVSIDIGGRRLSLHEIDDNMQSIQLIAAELSDDTQCLINVADRRVGGFLVKDIDREFFVKSEAPTPLDLKCLFANGKMHQHHLTTDEFLSMHEWYKPQTELHTHFTGAIRNIDLVDVATNKGKNAYPYPVKHLQAMGINVDKYWLEGEDKHAATIDIRRIIYQNENVAPEVSGYDRQIFMDALTIPQHAVYTFKDMGSIYSYRKPFAENKALFGDYLRAICRHNLHLGIKAISLSMANITDPAWLAIADEVSREFEHKRSFQLRFLRAISRSAAPEYYADTANELRHLAWHPCIEGVDVLAEETNSTYEFYPQLEELAQWAQKHDPSFVFRVHAGESSYHIENVRAVLELADKYKVHVRIGHGIHGMDETTIALAKRLAEDGLVIFEANPFSNLCLNYLNNVEDYSLKTFIAEQIPFVFGTDGGPIYQASGNMLPRIMSYMSTVDYTDGVAQLKRNEDYYIAVNQASINRKKRSPQMLAIEAKTNELLAENTESSNEDKDMQPFQIKTRQNKMRAHARRQAFELLVTKHNQEIHCTKEAVAAYYGRLKTMKADTERYMENNGVTMIKHLKEAFPGRKPIFIDGAIIDGDPESLQKSEAFINSLLKSLNPEKVVFLTSGNRYGLQKRVQELVAEHNAKHPERAFPLVGAVADSAHHESISKKITHGFVPYKAWYSLHAFIADSVMRDDVKVVAIGGGMQSRDIVQNTFNAMTYNHKLRPNKTMTLVTDVAGASRDKSPSLPANLACTFATVCERFHDQCPELFIETRQQFEMNYQQSLAAIVAQDRVEKTPPLHRQGPIEGLSINDRAHYLCLLMKKVDNTIGHESAKDYIARGCPPKHQVADVMRAHPDRFSEHELEPIHVRLYRPSPANLASHETEIVTKNKKQAQTSFFARSKVPPMQQHQAHPKNDSTSEKTKTDMNPDEKENASDNYPQKK